MNWPVVPLGEVAETALGKMLDKGKSRGHGHVPYLRNVNVQWGRIDTDDLQTMELAVDERERFEVRDGDLLACEGGDVGRCAIWQGRSEYLAYQKALHRIRPSAALDTRFLRYLLEHHSKSGILAKLSTGSTIAHLPQQQLRRVPVPLPPLPEQRRIIEILEDHLSRLDAAERNLLGVCQRATRLRRRALDDYFGSQASVPLGDLVTDISAGKSFGASSSPAGEDEWGIVKVSAMTWGTFNPDENKAVSAELADPRFEIREGDLLISRANTADYVGASVLVGKVRPKLLLSDKSLRISPAPGVNAEWLLRALQAPNARGQISRLATGTKDSMRNISQASLRQVMLPAASSIEQAQALTDFARFGAAADRLQASTDNAVERSKRLRRSLLTAAFSSRLSERVVELPPIEELVLV